jgi:leucyl aminopeptidase
MTTIVRGESRLTGKEEVVVLPLCKGGALTGLAKKLDVLSRSTVSRAIRDGRFSCEAGATLLLQQRVGKAPDHILFVGLGEAAALNGERVARAAGSAARTLQSASFRTCHVVLDGLPGAESSDAYLHPFLKGLLLAQYRYMLTATREPSRRLTKVTVLGGGSRGVGAALRYARLVVDHTEAVRDLVNAPADRMTPSRLADEAKSLAGRHGIQCSVMGLRDLQRLKMGAVIAVAQGSREEPRFITLHYNKRPRHDLPRVCLVGKGVTFDTGGISIKPWADMNEMKGDMAGGALVMGVTAAAARDKLPVEIIALVPCVENMPSGSAFRPGDVITTYAGKTIEVLSTDAEGRLILSDALAYACEFKPDVIVDFATLTGAVSIALGTRIAAALGNSQPHIDLLIEAGRAAIEPVWQLPLDDLFSESVRGDISDYKNYSGRDGSTITAAALLGEFVGKVPWVHLDIAGTSWGDGKVSYQPRGATGYGVDLVLRFLRSLAKDR